MTTKPPSLWGAAELALADRFVIAPADTPSILALFESPEPKSGAGLSRWLKSGLKSPPANFKRPGAIDELRAYLGEEVFQWLCACAVYPELQWNLTTYLGTLLNEDRTLLNEENLLRLVRLPWFRSGSMPDELRWQLIQRMDKRKEQIVREALVRLLETNPAERLKQTFAADDYQMKLAVHRYLYQPGRKNFRKLRRAIKELSPDQVGGDHVLVRSLERVRQGSLAMLLPKRLRRVFYPRGLAVFGMTTLARLAVTLVVILAAAGALSRLPGPPPAAKILEFSADRLSIVPGQEVRLCYKTQDAAWASIASSAGPEIGKVEPTEEGCIPVKPDQTTTYMLTAGDRKNRTVAQQLIVEVTAPDELSITKFYAESPTIPENGKTRLCYGVANAMSVHIDPSVGNVPPLGNNCIEISPAQTTTYTLTASNDQGGKQVKVIVTVTPNAVSIDEFSANPTTVPKGGFADISFKVSNAHGVRLAVEPGADLQGDNPADYSKRNHVRVGPITQTTTYTLTATDQRGNKVARRLTIIVTGEAPFDLVFTQSSTSANGTTLCYSIKYAASAGNQLGVLRARIEPDVVDIKPSFTIQCITVKPARTTTYTFQVWDSAGNLYSKQLTVVVPDVGQPGAPGGLTPGVDFSQYNAPLDWSVMGKSDTKFVFLRATQGTSSVDSKFAASWAALEKSQIIRGAYHIFMPRVDPVAQAQFFLKTVDLKPGDLPPVLDVVDGVGTNSSPDKGELTKGIRIWLKEVEAATKRKPIIYTSKAFWDSYILEDFGDYALWLASYTGSPTTLAGPALPRGWKEWTFWQYSDRGNLPGGQKGDVNWFNGTYNQLRNFSFR